MVKVWEPQLTRSVNNSCKDIKKPDRAKNYLTNYSYKEPGENKAKWLTQFSSCNNLDIG